MSAALDNLIIAVQEMAVLKRVPAHPGGDFFQQLDSLAALDHARNSYFHDAASLKIFDWVQQYRAVRSFYGMPLPVTLPNTPFTPEAWAKLIQSAQNLTGHAEDDYILDRIDTWLLESYSLPGLCEAEPGDIVLDCGTYTGNTSLYFAQKIGPGGHVYGFEAATASFKKYAKNMAGAGNITPVHTAVYDQCGEVSLCGDSFAARVGKGGDPVPALTLDAFCQSKKLPRVDFIKMDVEGAEVPALNGAKEIIQKYKPKMALSAYHKADDLITIPALVLSICPDYTFQLRHFSDNLYETVLYCIPGQNRGNRAASQAAFEPPAKQHPSAFGHKYLTLLEGVFALFKNSVGRVPDKLDYRKMLKLAGEELQGLLDRNHALEVENIALKSLLRKKTSPRAA